MSERFESMSLEYSSNGHSHAGVFRGLVFVGGYCVFIREMCTIENCKYEIDV